MSAEDQAKWNAKYTAGAYESKQYPGEYLAAKLPEIIQHLEGNAAERPWHALDLACGAGRNAYFLAANGFEVDAVDISAVGLARAQDLSPIEASHINWIQQDLEDATSRNFARYQLIVMMRYVNLPLLRSVTDNLVPGGFVLCEEHMRSEEDVVGPRNPAFRVASGALKETLIELTPIHYNEGVIVDPNGDRSAVAQIIARKD